MRTLVSTGITLIWEAMRKTARIVTGSRRREHEAPYGRDSTLTGFTGLVKQIFGAATVYTGPHYFRDCVNGREPIRFMPTTRALPKCEACRTCHLAAPRRPRAMNSSLNLMEMEPRCGNSDVIQAMGRRDVKQWKIFIILNLVLIVSSIWPAYADNEDWVFFFTNLAGDRFYYNQQSIVHGRDKTIKVVQKVSPRQVDSDIREVGTVVELDCSRLTYRRLKSASLLKTGEIKSAFESSEWNSIPPGSPTEILSQELCSKVRSGGRLR